MNDDLARVLVTESSWIAPSVVFAIALSLWVLLRTEQPARRRIAAASNAYSGTLIAALALGHMVAVSIKASMGTVAGSLPWLWFIGVALFFPAMAVVLHTRSIASGKEPAPGRTATLNLVLVVALLVTGPRNLPLAIPAILNAIYARHRAPWVGHAAVVAQVIAAVVLLAGSLLFLASGGSFEDFAGMDAG